jgi:hypothetical protein
MSPSASSPRMISTPRSVQQLDPLGTLDGRPVSVGAGIGVFALTLTMAWLVRGEIANPLLAVGALLAAGLASTILVVSTSPLRAPLTRLMHSVAVGSALLAFALGSASLGGSISLLGLLLGPAIIGLTCVALAPFRPVRELVGWGLLATIVTGVIALARSTAVVTDASPTLIVLFCITPVLTLSLGGAAFARSVALKHQRWELRAAQGARRQREREHASVARSVQQDRVTILNRDVVPLFTEVSRRGILSRADQARAAEYSAPLRELMVSEVNRSWLESVVALSFGVLDDGQRVHDPDRLASAMSAHQRTALRVAVLAVAAGEELVIDSVRLVIEKTSRGAVIIVDATVVSSASSWRASLAPFFAVLRVVFTSFQVSYHSPSLTVRFTYDIL